ncbi:hypothetical protein GCM10027294_43660 [Marinactinospora endophytica]
MSPARILIVVGAALAVGGLVLGLVPLDHSGASCGSAFLGTSSMHDVLVGSQGCSAARSAVLPWAWALIAAGLVVGLGPQWAARIPVKTPSA